MTNFSNFLLKNGFTIGTFYSAEAFFGKLAKKFAFLSDPLGQALYFFRNRDFLPVGSADDRVARKAICSALELNSDFKGFCKISPKRFAAKVTVRTTPFLKDKRRKLKATAIEQQLKPSVFKVDRNIYKKAVSLVRDHLLINKANLIPASPEDSVSKLNLQASGGYPYFRKKVFVLLDLLFDSVDYLSNWSQYAQHALLLYPAYVAYRVQQRSSDVKLRLIYVYPGLITVIEQMFLGPILSFFSVNRTPYAIGNNGDILTLRYSTWQLKANQVSIDWSGFDWYANSYVIKDSFALLKDMFKSLSVRDSFLFDLVSYYFMFTPILTTNPKTLKDEIVYKRRGVPSGSSFTNLIDTVVNLIVTYYYMLSKGQTVEAKFVACLGDDIIVATNFNFCLEDFAHESLKSFGMIVSVEKSKVFRRGERVYFLGALIDLNGRYINPELALFQIATTTSDLFKDCETSEDHFIRVHDKLCSVLFKYSDGYKMYDPIVKALRSFLKVEKDLSIYTEIFPRATAPSERFQQSVRSISFMKYNGWRIQ